MSKTVVIFGANGFLGRYLCRYFSQQGAEVVAIARSREGWSGDGMFLEWDGENQGPWALSLEGADAVINLTGKSVNCRYTPMNRDLILQSRVKSTTAIGKAIAGCAIPPKVWLNASTATWYRHAEDRPQNDWLGEQGSGFSYEIAQAWEDAFYKADIPAATRKVALRIGMVLANEKNTVYQVLFKLASRGMGGTMGTGRQRISWIHMDDFLRAVDFIIKDPFLNGCINITAPEFPTNREWMAYFRRTAGIKFGLPANEWMMRLGAWLLRTETELVLKSRWADPVRLKDAGFHWRWDRAESAIQNLRARYGLDRFQNFESTRCIGVRGWVSGASQRA